MNRFSAWLEDRTGLVSATRRVMEHRAPRGSKWAYVFGSATLFALILQVVTGITLALVYTPSSATAYQSLQHLSQPGTPERVVRGLHYFGASLMVVMIGVHLIRVYLTAAYKYPREVQWFSGVILLFLTVIMAFTGQVLRWDQNAVWSIVVGAEQAARTPWLGKVVARFLLGGDSLGAETLPRIFGLHVFWVPALIFGLVGLHLFLVLRNGISEPPRAGELVDPRTYKRRYQEVLRRDGVPFWPDAAWRDAVFGSLCILAVVALALWLGPPPLVGQPDPTMVQADPRPDWYLQWYFALLALWPYPVTNALLIVVPLLAIVGLFIVPIVSNRGERAPSRRPWSIFIVLIAVGTVAALTLVGLREPWYPHENAQALPASVVNSRDAEVVKGARLFHDKTCIACHAIAGYGGHRGPDLSAVGGRLTPEQLTWRIQNGAASMPPYAGRLTGQELGDLVKFLGTRQ